MWSLGKSTQVTRGWKTIVYESYLAHCFNKWSFTEALNITMDLLFMYFLGLIFWCNDRVGQLRETYLNFHYIFKCFLIWSKRSEMLAWQAWVFGTWVRYPLLLCLIENEKAGGTAKAVVLPSSSPLSLLQHPGLKLYQPINWHPSMSLTKTGGGGRQCWASFLSHLVHVSYKKHRWIKLRTWPNHSQTLWLWGKHLTSCSPRLLEAKAPNYVPTGCPGYALNIDPVHGWVLDLVGFYN